MVVVFEIGIQVNPPSVEYSHRITLPICPLNVSTPLLVGAQTVAAAGATVPPAEFGITVIVAGDEDSAGQAPLCTIALYIVVVTRLRYVCVVVVFTIVGFFNMFIDNMIFNYETNSEYLTIMSFGGPDKYKNEKYFERTEIYTVIYFLKKTK